MRYIVGNWKMNLGPAAAANLVQQIVTPLQTHPTAECAIWIAPPALSLAVAVQAGHGSCIKFGVQNVHQAEQGAFTGEISVPMAREAGASFAIVGHSERRHHFGESPSLVADRSCGALRQGFTTILCCGETLAQREAGETLPTLELQLTTVADRMVAGWPLILAYEPVWAIGTGLTPALSDIQHAHTFIRDLFTSRKLPAPPILYGGSVTPDNIAAICSLTVVQGALVGGASLSADKFLAMARTLSRP